MEEIDLEVELTFAEVTPPPNYLYHLSPSRLTTSSRWVSTSKAPLIATTLWCSTSRTSSVESSGAESSSRSTLRRSQIKQVLTRSSLFSAKC